MPIKYIIFSLLLLGFTSCTSDNSKKANADIENEIQKPPPPTLTGNQGVNNPVRVDGPPVSPEPPQNADGVWHYTCTNGCAGGAGGPESCGSCGNALTHNAAYHSGTVDPNQPNLPPTTATPPPPPAPEPPQNANGVWHYTCAAGCAGGAGGPETCGGCGGTLAHNAAYHQ